MSRPHTESGPARLVVLGDSLAFHGPEIPLPPAWPDFFPSVLRGRLAAETGRAWTSTVVAREGWGLRDVWLALQKDVHLQQDVLMGADAVVLAAGSFDFVPVGMPTPLRALIPYLRPPTLRRRVRVGLDRAHPWLVRTTRGALVRTPPSVYAHCWRKSVEALRLFAPDAALCAVLPSIHRAGYYAHRHPHHAAGMALTRRLASELDVPLVDLADITGRHLGELNPDGLHWGWAQHREVGEAMAATLLPRVLQARPRPERAEG